MKDGSQVLIVKDVFARSAVHILGIVLLLGCEPARVPAGPTISLHLRGAPPDATVTVDDNAIGTFDFVAVHGVALPRGLHHVTVAASGYFPWDRTVEAKPGGAPIALQVALTPVPE